MESQTGNPSGSRRKLVFEYDANSTQIGKKVYVWNGSVYSSSPNTTLKFLCDGWDLLAELEGGIAVVRSYQWGADLSGLFLDAGGVGGLPSMKPAGSAVQFIVNDGNGNVTALVDGASGALAAGYEYGPFGEGIRSSGSQVVCPIRFSSKYQDVETGLINYGYRYYNASLGKWQNADLICERFGIELNQFVANARTSSTDKDGRLAWRWRKSVEVPDPEKDCGVWHQKWILDHIITSGECGLLQRITLIEKFNTCVMKCRPFTKVWWETIPIEFGRFRGDITDDDRHKGHASTFGTQSTEAVTQLIRSNEAIDAIIRTWMANDPNAPTMYTATTLPEIWDAAAQTFTRYSSAVWGCCCDRYSTPSHSP